MTTVGVRPPKGTSHPGSAGRSSVDPRRFPLGYVWLAIFAVTVVGFLLVSRTGVDSPRIANPDPQWTYDLDGVPRATEPFLGIRNWAMVYNVGVLVAGLAVWGTVLTLYRRGRAVQHILVLMIALTVIYLQDPFSNYSYSSAFDPRVWHFPVDWPFVSLAPTVEPIINVFGYMLWYLPPALIALWLYRKVVTPRASFGSRWNRHPRMALFLLGFGVGTVWDIAMELLLIRSQIYVYTQLPGGPFTWSEGRIWQFHLLWCPLAQLFIFGINAVLLHRDDRGETLAARSAHTSRIRLLRGNPLFGQAIVASALVFVTYMAANLIFLSFKVVDRANSLARPWPYQETKLYDPQDKYQDLGDDGPFYDGVLSSWLNVLRND